MAWSWSRRTLSKNLCTTVLKQRITDAFLGDCSPNHSTNWSRAIWSSSNASRDDSFTNEPSMREDHSRFFRKLDKLPHARDSLENPSILNDLNWLEDNLGSNSDGIPAKLRKAATFFEFDENEISAPDYNFRPDLMFRQGTTYNTKDLDLTKKRPNKFSKRVGFEVTTGEVLKRADFRNVNFLANFLTVAGIIIKRKQTGISAKAQRRVAREIKTARAFGLLPFITMGTKPFVAGANMESREKDYEYDRYPI